MYGFKREPVLLDVLKDCIVQSPQDALHLIEGCLKKHLFPWLAGKKEVARPGSGATWERYLAQQEAMAITPEQQGVVDERWLDFCARIGRSCSAAPFRSGGSMSGEDWYILDWAKEHRFLGAQPQLQPRLRTQNLRKVLPVTSTSLSSSSLAPPAPSASPPPSPDLQSIHRHRAQLFV
eukprot:g75810.t1